tara:strand:- start:41 stop:337 length:297 start_codon:yes stop_codon:yes gene_type:complete
VGSRSREQGAGSRQQPGGNRRADIKEGSQSAESRGREQGELAHTHRERESRERESREGAERAEREQRASRERQQHPPKLVLHSRSGKKRRAVRLRVER